MKLILIRHAEAGSRDEFQETGKPDSLRPITARGGQKFEKMVTALEKLGIEINVIGTSPYARTYQTAQLVAKKYRSAKVEKVDSLKPGGRVSEVVRWLKSFKKSIKTVALVGHEPDLSGLFCKLLTGRPESFFRFKKGGIAILSFDDFIDEGCAELVGVLQPGQLKKIGRAFQ